jgi:hypothetical protein
MTTHDLGPQDSGAELVGPLKPRSGASIGNGQIEAAGYATEWTDEASQNAIQGLGHTAIVRDTASRADMDVKGASGELLLVARSYDALESDFRSHHQTSAAQHPGPYEYYRLIYRYGYDLGADPRYCSAEWAKVEQDARPWWEERNPGTWQQFEHMIQYAWNKARGCGCDSL